ncbi:sensor histidine kinase [Polaromonas sp.]|uniref:histidine kinase n=2 Tax=Polaromonas aquatica TaxID=332657 RepID=A0ABW1U4J6_9BURK
MATKALRNHARQMLTAISIDIDTAQTQLESTDKSHGKVSHFKNTAASIHGTLREGSGFTLVQLTAEFRALRASVLRLWLAGVVTFDEGVTHDIVRFNEAVDQALAESAVTFSHRGSETRDRMLAILGHDLRTPLSAISMSGQLLARLGNDSSKNESIGLRLQRSAATMTAMVNDLLEYSRSQLDGKMPHTPENCSIGEVAHNAVDESRLAHPECEYVLEVHGELNGYFDCIRMQQVMTNLLANAAQYREPGTPVKVKVAGQADEVKITVSNYGEAIPPESMEAIFLAMVQLPLDEEVARRPSTSMGLGLFVARQIVELHGGTIEVRSNREAGTSFEVTIPRRGDW